MLRACHVIAFVTWAAAGATVAFAGEAAKAKASQPFVICKGGFRHDCVVDGDTFWIGRMKVRLAAIDTPEITDAKCASERQRGEAARDRLLALLNDREWELVVEGKDRYRRSLGRLVTGDTDIGAMLVKEGFARPYGGHRRPWC